MRGRKQDKATGSCATRGGHICPHTCPQAGVSEANRIGRQLFKLSVEQNVNNHILASDTDIDAEHYMKMRALSVDQVKRTNGEIRFTDVLQQEKEL